MECRQNEAKYEEKYKRWKINVQRDGKRRSFYSSLQGKKGKIEAEKKADKWIASGNTDAKRLDEAYAEFLKSKSKKIGESYLKKLESYYRIWLAPSLAKKRVSSITNQDWQDCIDKAYKENKSRKTLQNIRGAITSFYTFCRKKRWDMERPDLIDIPDDAPVKEKIILQPDDIKTLFTVDGYYSRGKYHKSFYIYAFRFVVVLGLRRGELAGIKKEDIQDGVLSIRRSVNYLGIITSGKNKNALRTIVLPEIAKKILQDQYDHLKELGIESEWIFPNENGQMMSTNAFYKKWETYGDHNNIDVSLHELRHTMISVSKDVPKELLKAFVGHSEKMDTFGVYGHEVAGEREHTAALINAAFEKIIPH